MTTYLLDENVLRELRPQGHDKVRKWASAVDERDLRLSAITFLERCRGWELRLRRDPYDEAARSKLAAVATLQTAYAERIVPIDAVVASEWARQLGTKGNNDRDAALAAAAKVHGMVLVTRNIRHFAGRGISLLDPFTDPPLYYPANSAAPPRKS